MKYERFSFLKVFTVILLLGLVFAGCEKEVVNDNDDPIIGNWKLKAYVSNGDTTDVSNITCFKDSYINVTATTMSVKTMAPKSGGGCETVEGSSNWENSNGRYWQVEGSEKTWLNITLSDNNSILSVNTPSQTVTSMIYRK